MAMAKCRECGKEVSSEAETCPHCGIEKPARKSGLKKFATWAAIIVAVVGGGRIVAGLTGGPKCEIVDIETSPEVFVIAGEFDAGFAVALTVKNTSSTGQIEVVSVLSTSEGNFRRTQSIVIEQDQQMKLEYQFHEPTINAKNVQAQVSCSPG